MQIGWYLERFAVVSGLGPNGVLAALELLGGGYHVTVVEKRPSYTRPIHLHLRATYLNDVRRLSPELHAQLLEISTPIEEHSHQRMENPAPSPQRRGRWLSSFANFFGRSDDPQECRVARRLNSPPQRHVRLDCLEKLFYSHLKKVAGENPDLTIRRGFDLELESDGTGRYRASIRKAKTDEAPEDLGFPDLVVLSEGGKSASVSRLGLENIRFSHPKHFMSAHVDVPIGPRTRRIDIDVRKLLRDASVGRAEVSLWACGHGNLEEGTWIVIEVPEDVLTQTPERAETIFEEGAILLLQDLAVPFHDQTALSPEELRERIQSAIEKGALLTNSRGAGGSKGPFAGTFKFEQQCLLHPAAGKNVIVLGDAAGMGHHALSSGLEMGACDLLPLRCLMTDLVDCHNPAEALDRYAEAVFDSRIKLLALGMQEYYPDLPTDPREMLYRAAEFFRSEQGV